MSNNKRIRVKYLGPADVIVGVAKTQERPDGYEFRKEEPTEVPAGLFPILEQIAAFEVVPDPAPLPSIPDDVQPVDKPGAEPAPIEEKESNGT